MRLACGCALLRLVGGAGLFSWTDSAGEGGRRGGEHCAGMLQAGSRVVLQWSTASRQCIIQATSQTHHLRWPQVLDGPCCARAGSCSSLRSGLNGFEGITSDLCNAGQNRCDGQGRLIHLALVNEVRTACAGTVRSGVQYAGRTL